MYHLIVVEMSTATKAFKLRKVLKMNKYSKITPATVKALVSSAYAANDFVLGYIKDDKVYAAFMEDFADNAWFYMENDGKHIRRSISKNVEIDATVIIPLGWVWDFDRSAFEKYGHNKNFRAYYFEDAVAEKFGMVVNSNRRAPRATEYDIHSIDGKYGIECKYIHARVL